MSEIRIDSIGTGAGTIPHTAPRVALRRADLIGSIPERAGFGR